MGDYGKTPLDYVPSRGIIEVRYGVENEEISFRKDLYDYVRDELRNGKERFHKDFACKDKTTGKRYWFACIVCPCDLSSPVTMVAHVGGQRHQKKAIAKQAASTSSRCGSSSGHSYGSHKERKSDRIPLVELLRQGPDIPFVGLEFITEYVNPGNPDSKRMYTCSLNGCNGTWGTASEMYNHLRGEKLKHSKNYLIVVHGCPNLQRNIVYDKCRDIYQQQIEENRGQKDFSLLKTVCDTKMYLEIANRPLDWSESKAQQKADLAPATTDLSNYEPLSIEESARNSIDEMDALLTQIGLNIERIRSNCPDAQELKALTKTCLNQVNALMKIMAGRREPLAMQALSEKCMELNSDFSRIMEIDALIISDNIAFEEDKKKKHLIPDLKDIKPVKKLKTDFIG